MWSNVSIVSLRSYYISKLYTGGNYTARSSTVSTQHVLASLHGLIWMCDLLALSDIAVHKHSGDMCYLPEMSAIVRSLYTIGCLINRQTGVDRPDKNELPLRRMLTRDVTVKHVGYNYKHVFRLVMPPIGK